MIEDQDVARQVSDLMLEISNRLTDSIALVRGRGSPVEFRVYRLAVAKVLAKMLFEIKNPLYARHPNLKPEGLQ